MISLIIKLAFLYFVWQWRLETLLYLIEFLLFLFYFVNVCYVISETETLRSTLFSEARYRVPTTRISTSTVTATFRGVHHYNLYGVHIYVYVCMYVCMYVHMNVYVSVRRIDGYSSDANTRVHRDGSVIYII